MLAFYSYRRIASKYKYILGLIFVFFVLGYILLAVGIHRKVPRDEEAFPIDPLDVDFRKSGEIPAKHKRDLKRMPEQRDEQKHVDVLKLIPKRTADLVAQGKKMTVVNIQGKNVTAILAKMKALELKKQQMYLSVLRKRGQVVKLPGGGEEIVSFPDAKVVTPNTLKDKLLKNWTLDERIWANVTHYRWTNEDDDEKCGELPIKFHDMFDPTANPFEVIGIVSYPSSGNSWLRYLIEGVSGVFTGSLYNDQSLKREAFYGEGIRHDQGMTVAVKSHGFTTGDCLYQPRSEQVHCNHFKNFRSRAILVIRNPFKAIIGHRNLDSGGHKGFAKGEDFRGQGWDHFVRIKIDSWENFYLDWLAEARSEDVLVIHYEHLKENLDPFLRSAVRFLDGFNAEHQELQIMSRPDFEDRMRCTLTSTEGKVKRDAKRERQRRQKNWALINNSTNSPIHKSVMTSRSGKLEQDPDDIPVFSEDKVDPFTAEQRILIRAAIARVNRALTATGKTPAPIEKYEFYKGNYRNT